MMCERPYMRTPFGVNRIQLCSEAGREAATPFPCGRCLPCRISKSRMLTGRILMESQLHKENTFSTFTYDEENLPKDRSLDPKTVRNFIRRLRHAGLKFRYFFVGEYGEAEGQRPHYHSIMFGIGPKDHDTLDRVWTNGITKHGTVTSASAKYVTGYAIKALSKTDDSRLRGRKPEFVRSSRDPEGIGTPYIKEIARQIIEHGVENECQFSTVKIGGKTYPLGGYLSDKLIEYTIKNYGKYLDAKEIKLAKYQRKIFERYKSECWFNDCIEEKETARQSQKKLLNLYAQKKGRL